MARPKIDGTDYKVSIHKNGAYMYACTQPRLTDDEGKTYSRRIHWGTVDDKKVFHPNSRYLYTDASERGRLVFPSDWDMSEAKRLTEFIPAIQMEINASEENVLLHSRDS